MDLALNNLQKLICHKTETNKMCSYVKLNCLNRTVYLNKKGLALNNLQWLICSKTQPSQTKPF